jgi:hypothetical protein
MSSTGVSTVTSTAAPAATSSAARSDCGELSDPLASGAPGVQFDGLSAGQLGGGGVQRAAAAATAGPGGALPHLDRIQSSFGGIDVSGVKAHTGAQAAAANASFGSDAFATGGDVAFASPAPDLHTAAHETAHVVQQRDGVQLKGGVGAAGDAYERHADAVADAVVAGRSAEGLLAAGPSGGGGGPAVQLKPKSGHVDAIDERVHDGSQDRIQPKMVAVCREMLGDGVTPEIEQWFTQVVGNGLCGGWAAVHRAAPELLLKAWAALEDWSIEDGVDALSEEDKQSVVSVITTAYDTMNELEPDAEYGDSPDDVKELGSEIVPKETKRVASFKIRIPEEGGGGRMLLSRILDQPKVKVAGNRCTMHIETQRHHMSMRTRAVNGEVRILDVVESERRGVVVAPSTAEAIGVLDSGLYLDLTDFEVEVEVFVDV